ncbi:hypothetical protein VPNG_00869 [Cytospora leucostoma]|uniref:Uncharacterized protein n=1 Tax=Cytospora leucostoma TaxID=1230097 RepID=A0A423XMZ0_9PEZI|nr:hypothetical protein VPNG_00869 [Cytospora leucostoma]
MRFFMSPSFALCSILSFSATQITSSTASSSKGSSTSTGTNPASSSTQPPPDVLLRVPNLSVGRIELDVDNLSAEINLAAEVASLVKINAGVQVGIEKVNLTIVDVQAELDLIVRLEPQVVSIVNRTLATLDLAPGLVGLLNGVTDVAGNVVGNVVGNVGDVVDNVLGDVGGAAGGVVNEAVGSVDGLLGSITQGSKSLNYIIDDSGNIVQVTGVAGKTVTSIVGNYQQNMTYTGQAATLPGGLVEKTYKYSPLGALVNVIFNSLGQVVQTTVVTSKTGTGSKAGSTGGDGVVQRAASGLFGLLGL